MDGVVAVLVEDILGARLAIDGAHRFEISGNGRIVGMNGMRHAGVAMAVWPGPDSHILKKFIG